MAVREKTELEKFTRGGDVFSHKLAMFAANAGRVATKAIAIGIICGLMCFWLITTPGQRDVANYYQVARLETLAKLGTSNILARHVYVESVGDLGTMRPYQIVDALRPAYEKHLVGKTFLAILVMLASGIGSIFGIAKFYKWYGQRAGEEEIRRGALQTTVPDLNKAVAASREGASDITIAGVTLPADAPMKNSLFLGPMGTGKSVLMLNVADQVLLNRNPSKPRKAIIYDKTGELTSYYYREGKDVLLSPLDVRGTSVNLFAEISIITDFKQICESVIPMPDGGNSAAKFFAESAQTLTQCVMEKLWMTGEANMEILYKVLNTFDLPELRIFLKGTPGGVLIQGDGEQVSGIMQAVQQATSSFRYFKTGDFSIRDWVKSDEDSNIFITSQEQFHDVMRGSYYLLVDLAVRASMSGKQYRHDRLWIFLDELASLGSLPILKRSLTEARKYGVAHAVGLQHLAQAKELFGNNISQVIRSNLQNFVCMRLPDEASRTEIAKDFGMAEVDENTEGLSFGAASSRDGSSVQTSRRDKLAVTEGEIKKLKNLEGYLQIAGSYDPVKVEFANLIKNRPIIAEPFIAKPELTLLQMGSGRLTGAPAKPSAAPIPPTNKAVTLAVSEKPAQTIQPIVKASPPIDRDDMPDIDDSAMQTGEMNAAVIDEPVVRHSDGMTL